MEQVVSPLQDNAQLPSGWWAPRAVRMTGNNTQGWEVPVTAEEAADREMFLVCSEAPEAAASDS